MSSRGIRNATAQPFAVGSISDFIAAFARFFDAALEAKQTLQLAGNAVAVGADILVAQGNEAGGHTGALNLLPLLAHMLDTFPDVPIMAAGGIASGRTLAAALAADADGAWVGTALLATPEAVEVSDDHKRRVVQSDGEDTVYTEVFDIVEEKVFGIAWPEGIASRAYRNRFVSEWHHRETEPRSHLHDVVPAPASTSSPRSHQWTSRRRNASPQSRAGPAASAAGRGSPRVAVSARAWRR